MLFLNERKFIAIGCSCLTQFQAQSLQGQTGAVVTSGLLDWNILSPAATLRILQRQALGMLEQDLTTRTNYQVAAPSGKLVNTALPGFYFWHEDAAAILSDTATFDAFCSKMRHLIAKTFAPAPNVHLIWSNLQPNLKSTIQTQTPQRWGAYRLTQARAEAIRHAAARVFDSPVLHFVCRDRDCAADMLDHPDVHLLRLPRGHGYRGPTGLYAPVFNRIIHPKPSVEPVPAGPAI